MTLSSFAIVLVDARHYLLRHLISPYGGLQRPYSQQFDDGSNCRICFDAVAIAVIDTFPLLLSRDKDVDFDYDIVCIA